MDDEKKITIWERFYPDDFGGCYKHNHIEDGWAKGVKPIGNEEQTRQWANHGWMRVYAHLIDGHVVRHRGSLAAVAVGGSRRV